MSQGRRLLLAWIAASLCWIGYWCWHDASTCSLHRMSGGHAITCRWTSLEAGATVVMSRTSPALPELWHMFAQAIVLPLGVLLVGVVAGWAIDALRAKGG